MLLGKELNNSDKYIANYFHVTWSITLKETWLFQSIQIKRQLPIYKNQINHRPYNTYKEY